MILLPAVPGQAQSRQDILQFYWNRASETWQQELPADTVSYRLRTVTYVKNLNKQGQVSSLDSATIDYYYTGLHLDSQQVVSGNADGKFQQVSLTMPDIFKYPYVLSNFPNDDGRGPLAIGIDTDTSGLPEPTGLVLINRENYQPVRVYLHYANDPNYVRLSRSFQFTQRDGMIFPDSVWVNASVRGIFYPERYRIETSVTDIQLNP